ncbi:MAG: hypothetical protein QM536_04385 [Chitinophagaceae bacterium]|nr:hypothetical protein [Chitinophagaceae bacterium]
MKIAVIDCGTNTFNLLIGTRDSRGQENLYIKKKQYVKMGEGGISHLYITEAAQKRCIDALTFFKKEIDKEGCDTIIAKGTSAFRNAKNGKQFASEIHQKLNINIEIIDGEQESEYIYWGIKNCFDIGLHPSLIVDIGGGSVEFIIANRERIFWKKSVEIGVQRLLDIFQKSDPIQAKEIDAIENYIEKELLELFDVSKQYNITNIIGVSGTFTTIGDILLFQETLETERKYRHFPINTEDFFKVYTILTSKRREERMNIPGMNKERVDMIIEGCVLAYFLIKKIGIQTIDISNYSLKEGVFHSYMKNNYEI